MGVTVNQTVLSITAHLDLLGFSNHLILSSNDLRTKIGEEAIARLRVLESAISLMEEEMITSPSSYPTTFRFLRFNDSLIFGIDVSDLSTPSIGKPHKVGGFTYEKMMNVIGEDKNEKEGSEALTKHFDEESFKVSQFIGLVSRVHNYINEKESELHMPGCRMIISSGLRHQFIREKDKKEDYYSANFSLSNAYMANQLGSKHGFKGNKCYIEDSVAKICGYNQFAKRILGYAKFVRSEVGLDPFDGRTDVMLAHNFVYVESLQFGVELFNKEYYFRELNTIVSTNLHLFPGILKILDNKFKHKSESVMKEIINGLKKDTPELEDVNKFNIGLTNYPFLFLTVTLEEKISDAFKQFDL